VIPELVEFFSETGPVFVLFNGSGIAGAKLKISANLLCSIRRTSNSCENRKRKIDDDPFFASA
jgi:hypothetical protein